MSRFWTRAAGLTVFVSLIACLVVAAFAREFPALLSFDGLDTSLAALSVFDRFYLDFLLAILVGVLLVNGGWIRRCIAYLWCTLFFLSYLLQYLSVYVGGEFVSFLAVDNTNHVSLLVNRETILIACAFTAVVILFVWLVEFCCRSRPGWMSRWVIPLAVLLLAIGVHQNHRWLPTHILDAQAGFYNSKETRLAHKSPVESLYKVIFREDEDALKPLDSEDVLKASRFGIDINPGNRYPLVRDITHPEVFPFQTVREAVNPPNIIVFFAEGMSARTMDMYDGLMPSLTPNLDVFSESAMVVDNYFNHTFATYRGLLGQLCSFFPAHGGHGGWDTHYEALKTVRYQCLNDLLREEGYQTLFLDTHRADSGYIDEMMYQIGFDHVFNAEQVVEQFIGGQPLRRDALSDTQLMNGLVEILKQLERQKDAAPMPFFLGLYNLETHTQQRIRKDGKKYKGADNYVLDSIHNFDHAFGNFWSYFRNSKYFENTIVVFTSDHAHYPDRDFRAVVENMDNYQPYFVDRIPLIIYDPFRDLPARFDARFASSIDFAPSMAHWLNLGEGSTAFLGSSIFSSQRTGGVSLASADIEHFVIRPDGIDSSTATQNINDELQYVDYLMRSLREIERHDRIWPESEDDG